MRRLIGAMGFYRIHNDGASRVYSRGARAFLCLAMLRKIVPLLAAVILAMLLGGASVNEAAADEVPAVHFAGVAFLGNSSDNDTAFPYSWKLFNRKDSDGGGLNRELSRRLLHRNFDHLRLSTDYGSYKRGDSLALAFVLTWENVGREEYDGFTKLTVDLHAEALLFDVANMEVVSAFPFAIQYIDSISGVASEERIAAIVEMLYVGNQDNNIFEKFASTLARVRLKSSFGARMQIAEVRLDPSAVRELLVGGIQEDSARALLLSSFERFLSENGNVPILPHTEDQAIGRYIKASFADGDVQNLRIPEADYAIHLTLTNMRKIKVDETASQIAWAYASYLDVKIDQPLSRREYLNASFKFPVVKVVPSGGVMPDDRSGFQESLMSISNQITSQFDAPSSEWVSQWAVSANAAAQLSGMADLLARCR